MESHLTGRNSNRLLSTPTIQMLLRNQKSMNLMRSQGMYCLYLCLSVSVPGHSIFQASLGLFPLLQGNSSQNEVTVSYSQFWCLFPYGSCRMGDSMSPEKVCKSRFDLATCINQGLPAESPELTSQTNPRGRIRGCEETF